MVMCTARGVMDMNRDNTSLANVKQSLTLILFINTMWLFLAFSTGSLLLIGLVVFILSLVVNALFAISKLENEVRDGFKKTTPKTLVDSIEARYTRYKAMKGTKDTEGKQKQLKAEVLYMEAVYQCYYSEFDIALNTIGKADWEDHDLIGQPYQYMIEALVKMLKEHDFAGGLEYIKKAERLARISGVYDLYQDVAMFYDVHMNVTKALVDMRDYELIHILEREFYKVDHMVLKLLVSWAVSKAYLLNSDFIIDHHIQ